MFQQLHKEFKIVDNNSVSNIDDYLSNQKIIELLESINNIDINNLSISEAFTFIENLQQNAKKIKLEV